MHKTLRALKTTLNLPDKAYLDGEKYKHEPRGRWQTDPGLVIAPNTCDQVAQVVRACGRLNIPIIPYGGGTGLVGGQISQDQNTVVLTLERMNKIRAIYPQENVIIVDAGCILADVKAAAKDKNRVFPLSLASQGSAHIGGVLSTNAGGVNVLRYGNARHLCLGLEAVLPDGSIWNGLKRLYKDNTGYDVRNLLIGAEGTLGIITGAALTLFARPAQVATALLTVSSPAAALDLLSYVQGQLGHVISAFELIHRQSFDLLSETLPHIRQPFKHAPLWSVLIEVELPAPMDATHTMEAIFEHTFKTKLTLDGVIAKSQKDRADLWAMREHIPEANRRIGAISSHDISLPLGMIDTFITRATNALNRMGDFRINCFGHVGDGNLHYNVFPPLGHSPDHYTHHRPQIKSLVHDLTVDLGGSFSAEHGIGRLKVDDMERYADDAKLSALRAIKTALDPKGIMNPGAVLRADTPDQSPPKT